MLTSLDLHFLIRELQFLVGSRIDKIYHPSKEELLLLFNVRDQGKQMLRIIAGKALFLSSFKEEQGSPDGFCMFLRKYLDNAKLTELSQVGSERIARFNFEKERRYSLYVEFFGKGNIIFTDENNIIMNALDQKKWADREIMKGKEYIHPKKELNFFSLDSISPNKEIVMYLAKDLGLGGRYAEEICARTKINKKRKELNDDEKNQVVTEMRYLLSQKLEPRVIGREVLPFRLETVKGDKKDFDSLNKAYDFLHEHSKTFISKHQIAIEKLQRIVEGQEVQITELESKAEEEKSKAELIYERYELIDEILEELNKAREKYSFDEMNEKLKGHPLIKGVDGKTKRVTLEL